MKEGRSRGRNAHSMIRHTHTHTVWSNQTHSTHTHTHTHTHKMHEAPALIGQSKHSEHTSACTYMQSPARHAPSKLHELQITPLPINTRASPLHTHIPHTTLTLPGSHNAQDTPTHHSPTPNTRVRPVNTPTLSIVTTSDGQRLKYHTHSLTHVTHITLDTQ